MATGTGFDEIRYRGVLSRGYGQLAKIVMIDTDLTLEAKGIYAYFASYTGAGCSTAFPSRDKILHDLKVSKDTYYRHFNLLISHGYISVEQKKDSRFSHNVYTIENLPEKFLSTPEDAGEALKKAYALIREAQDISAAGYGNVPKSVMLDTEISLQAKAMYAYLCVWTGQDMTASPAKDTVLYHMGITHSSYNKYIKILLDSDYIARTSALTGGRFSGVVYRLNAAPQADNSPEAKFSDTVNKDTESYPPQAKFSDTEKQDAVKPDTKISDSEFSDTEISDAVKPEAEISDTVNPDTNNNNNTKTKKTKTNVNHNQSSTAGAAAAADGEVECYENIKDSVFDEIVSEGTIPYRYLSDPLYLSTAVRLITDWDVRSDKVSYSGENAGVNRQFFLLFVDALTEMLDANGTMTSVNGAKISYSKVYDALDSELETGEDIYGFPSATLGDFPDYVIQTFIDNSRNKKITNHKAYMKAIIWTSLTTRHISEYSDIVHDFHADRD